MTPRLADRGDRRGGDLDTDLDGVYLYQVRKDILLRRWLFNSTAALQPNKFVSKLPFLYTCFRRTSFRDPATGVGSGIFDSGRLVYDERSIKINGS
jgi:hypothetical protein